MSDDIIDGIFSEADDGTEYPIVLWQPDGEPTGEDYEPVEVPDIPLHELYDTMFLGECAENPIEPEKRYEAPQAKRDEQPRRSGGWLSSFLASAFPRRNRQETQPEYDPQDFQPVSKEQAREIWNR